MIDFVLEQSKNKFMSTGLISNSDILEKILNYANFLKQPLKLEMFVPCDADGNVFEEPTNLEKMQASWADNPIDNVFYKVRDYNKAKEKVLFDGFEIIHKDKVRITIQKDFFQLDYNRIKRCFENYNFIGDLVDSGLTLTKNIVNNKHEL